MTIGARRRSLVLGIGLILLAATGALAFAHRPRQAAAPTTTETLSTASVIRTDLKITRQFYGTIGFGSPTPITAPGAGQAYTWLPAPGAVISQGQRLYEVDGRAVPVLTGSRPMWRTLEVGDTPGPDIAQLNTGLVALGYASDIANGSTFDWRTRAAVENWQHAQGVLVTGIVEPGQIVFASTPLRVATVAASLGAVPHPGDPLLSMTSPSLQVTVPVPVDQAYLLHRGDAVTVTLPDAVTETPGQLTAISSEATLPDNNADGSRNNANPQAASVTMTITLAHPRVASGYTSAPVSVAVTTQQVRGVLAVPVTALTALPDGRFAVTVVISDGQRTSVPVSTGLYSDTLVQVSGAGLAVGTQVAIAS
jgi:peptidoglycan hydrolase-like protein with peptidoglycan-binding domain